MDHSAIDDNRVAERYLKHALLPHEHAAFEVHMVDCPECADRVLLAELFGAHNGSARSQTAARPAVISAPCPICEGQPIPLRARIAARLKPWQIAAVLVLAAILLLAVPTAKFLTELNKISRAKGPR